MKILIPFLLTLLVCSCSATLPPKKEAQKAPPGAEKELRSAEALAESGDSKKALARLKKFTQMYPDSDLTGEAHFAMAEIYWKNHQYNEALASYLAIVDSPVNSAFENSARLRAMQTYLKLSQPADAESLLKIGFRSQLSQQDSLELEKIKADTYLALKKNKDALLSLISLVERHPEPIAREKFRVLAQEVLDSKLTEDEIREVAFNNKFGYLQAPAKYRYALLMAEQRQYSRARALFAEVAQLSPGTELAERATGFVAQIDARSRVDERTIGVVLPLSGKQAAIGYKALKGIQLGLGIYGRTPSNFKLAIVDSEGNPDTARRAVERLVQEDNAIAIIGGLLSRTATAEATKAQELGIPAIMLSQKAGVTQAGDFVFRNSLTSQMQVEHLVNVAMNQLGYRNFAILYPNDAYGVEFANLFWDEVKARGGDIRGAQIYDPKETDFRSHMQRLSGLYYLEDRADEYRLRLKAFNEKNPKRSARQGGPSVEDLLPPIVEFDAVFVPDSARAVGQIAPMLAYNNITNVRLLGTNIWNSPGLISRGQKFVENSIFVDSFLATDPVFMTSDFFTNFKATFDEEPSLTEIQAYDSALILRQLIGSGERTRLGLQTRMSNLQNFTGALGPLSANGDREFRRPLTLLTIKDGKIVELDSIKR
jgi:branched-chain amino acid transport system substrate-binding protein